MLPVQTMSTRQGREGEAGEALGKRSSCMALGESSAGGPRSESGRLRLSGRRILLRWRWQAPPLGWPRPPDSFKKRSESKGAKHWFAQSLLRPHAMNKRAKLAQCFQRRQRQLALASLVPGPRTGSRRGGLKSCALKEERLDCNQVLETGCRQAVSHCWSVARAGCRRLPPGGHLPRGKPCLRWRPRQTPGLVLPAAERSNRGVFNR